MHAGLTAYQVEQEFGAWHVWVPTSLLGESGSSPEGLHVQITATELVAGSASRMPYLQVHSQYLVFVLCSRPATNALLARYGNQHLYVRFQCSFVERSQNGEVIRFIRNHVQIGVGMGCRVSANCTLLTNIPSLAAAILLLIWHRAICGGGQMQRAASGKLRTGNCISSSRRRQTAWALGHTYCRQHTPSNLHRARDTAYLHFTCMAEELRCWR